MDTFGEDDVISGYKQGISRTRLATLVGCSRTRVDHVLTRAGFDLTPRRLAPATAEGILATYRAGNSLARTARTWGVSISTVSLLARRAGIIRPAGRRPGMRMVGTLPPATVLALHAEGGIDAIGDALHCSTTSAYRILREAREASAA